MELIILLWRWLTLIMINFGWVIFNSSSVIEGITFCKGMMGAYIPFGIDTKIIAYFREYGFYILIGIVFSTPIARLIREKMMVLPKISIIHGIALPVIYGAVFLWAVSFLLLGAHNPFIYFNF